MAAYIRLALATVLAGLSTSHGSGVAAESCSNSNVEITWLGVTTYFVRYWHNGREIKLLLDDQIAKDSTSKALNGVLGANGKLDYIFIGHMHFDNNGACPEKIDSKCSPFQEQAANYSAKVVAPLRGCQLTKPGTECTTVYPSPSSPQVFELSDIGLRVTAIPSAHSYLSDTPGRGARGAPGCSDPQKCSDPFAYLLEFPGEGGKEEACASSFFWADTAHNRKPFLNGYYEKGDPSQPLLNYQRLLKQGFSKFQHNVRTSLMAFPAYFMPDERAWQEWAQIVRPLYHTNHHHGERPDVFWPDLSQKLEGSALGIDDATWIQSAEVPSTSSQLPAYAPTFMALDDFFTTFRMRGPSLVEKVDLGYAAKFRSQSVTDSQLIFQV